MRVEQETAAPGRTDRRPTGLEIRGAWNDHSRGRNNGRRPGHVTTQNGTDRVRLERPRGFLRPRTPMARAARSLCCPQRDKSARNPSFLLKNSQDFFGMATVFELGKEPGAGVTFLSMSTSDETSSASAPVPEPRRAGGVSPLSQTHPLVPRARPPITDRGLTPPAGTEPTSANPDCRKGLTPPLARNLTPPARRVFRSNPVDLMDGLERVSTPSSVSCVSSWSPGPGPKRPPGAGRAGRAARTHQGIDADPRRNSRDQPAISVRRVPLPAFPLVSSTPLSTGEEATSNTHRSHRCAPPDKGLLIMP